MQSGGARRGKANGGTGGHLGVGALGKHHVSARPRVRLATEYKRETERNNSSAPRAFLFVQHSSRSRAIDCRSPFG